MNFMKSLRGAGSIRCPYRASIPDKSPPCSPVHSVVRDFSDRSSARAALARSVTMTRDPPGCSAVVPYFRFRGVNVIDSLLERKIEKRPDQVRLQGRILFLTEDPELIRRQLTGEDLPWDSANPGNNPKLRDDISTDEITPAHYCFYFDETLGEIPYLGLKCGSVTPIGRGEIKRGGFVCAVSGKRRGKGSSREQSPYAEMCAGIRVVIAENIERIYKQNCQNLGLLTSTDFSLIDRIRAGEEIALSEFTAGEDEITRQVIEYGGLFPFNVARMQGKVFLPPIATASTR